MRIATVPQHSSSDQYELDLVTDDSPHQARAYAMSDDACVRRLAEIIEHRDAKDFDKVVDLIRRLVVPIELT